MSTISGLRVVRSRIDGYGVVATATYKATGFEIIADVEDVLLALVRSHRRSLYALAGDEAGYAYDAGRSDALDQPLVRSERRVEVGNDARRGPWAQIVALRPMRQKKINYDYAFAAEVAEPCRCGSRLCRGFIVDLDALHLVVRTPAIASGGASW